MKQVIVEVRGGIAEVVRLPKDIEVVIKDYDQMDDDDNPVVSIENQKNERESFILQRAMSYFLANLDEYNEWAEDEEKDSQISYKEAKELFDKITF